MRAEEYTEKLQNVLERASAADISTPDAREAFIADLPFHLRASYGGNTSCVYLNIEGTHIALDMGSGFRVLGQDLLTKAFGRNSDEIYVFLSHTHWDHIQGLPFFVPSYLEGNRMHIYSPSSNIADRLEMQQYAQFFPISLREMGAEFNYYQMELNRPYSINNFTVSSIKLNHPNNSYAYRFDYKGKSVVYATDTEFNEQSIDFIRGCVEFFRNADVLIFDSQYTSKESFEKLHWGHSSANTGIDIAIKSGVKRLVFFHHEPGYPDRQLSDIYKDIIRYRNMVARSRDLELIPAYEGLEITL
jgi:ribonuclease BN (tRNA processing enzyme)